MNNSDIRAEQDARFQTRCRHGKLDLVERLLDYSSENDEKPITITAIRGAVHYRKHCRF
jgi:hypothetical protein